MECPLIPSICIIIIALSLNKVRRGSKYRGRASCHRVIRSLQCQHFIISIPSICSNVTLQCLLSSLSDNDQFYSIPSLFNTIILLLFTVIIPFVINQVCILSNIYPFTLWQMKIMQCGDGELAWGCNRVLTLDSYTQYGGWPFCYGCYTKNFKQGTVRCRGALYALYSYNGWMRELFCFLIIKSCVFNSRSHILIFHHFFFFYLLFSFSLFLLVNLVIMPYKTSTLFYLHNASLITTI